MVGINLGNNPYPISPLVLHTLNQVYVMISILVFHMGFYFSNLDSMIFMYIFKHQIPGREPFWTPDDELIRVSYVE